MMPTDEEHQSESDFIRQLEAEVAVPQDLRDWYETKWAEDRKYVATLQRQQDSANAVVTNFVLRTQHSLVSNIYPRDPRPRLQPAEWIPAQESEVAPEAPYGDPLAIYPPGYTNYVRAQEIVVDKQQTMGGLKEVTRAAIQDALTLPIAVVKLRWQEDYARDPIGYGQRDPKNVAISRYALLKDAYDDGEFTDDDAQYYELKELAEAVKRPMAEQLSVTLQETPPEPETDILGQPTGPDPRVAELERLADPEYLPSPDELPQIPHYQGFSFEGIDPEDWRFDWNITRPEDIYSAWWMSHRVYMSPSEIGERWALDPEKLNQIRNASAEDSSVDKDGNTGTDKKAGEQVPARQLCSRGRAAAVLPLPHPPVQPSNRRVLRPQRP
jgi:hypothetical protein